MIDILKYLIVFVILLISILAYFKIARRFNIIDKPNWRSSHDYITIRGGGIIFPVAAIIYFVYSNFIDPYFIAGLIVLALISFWDDIKPISFKIRIVVQLLAVSLLFAETDLFSKSWYLIIIGFILVVGWINVSNFMDGINGIIALYNIVTIISLLFINYFTPFIPSDFMLFVLIAVVVFSFFNVRKKALAFSGDVGSVTLAYLLSWFIIKLIIETGQVEYLLLLAVFGIDSVITIIYRLKRKENIFLAHRTHLYQYLANERQWPHVGVSVTYSIIQLGINALSIWLILTERMSFILFTLIVLSLLSFYLLIRFRVVKKIIR